MVSATTGPPTEKLNDTVTTSKEEARELSCNDEIPNPWQCGQPYQFPLPAPNGDPWQTLLTPILEKDKARCDAWKDEVQNLLIFAGLFSAVVTAFVVETYKGLQEDPTNTTISLLSRIALDLENPPNGSLVSGSFIQPSFSPSSSIVRVNIFLFVSLILSLATVLIGIVSLQWLREHQAYTGSFTARNTFAAVHMRSEALEKWRVPEIFSALPIILQSALILFFVGIIDFLLHIEVRVAIPVAILIGITLVFLLITTMLPTLQGFVLHHPNLQLNNEIPVQCPYKSPQSRAFRRLIVSSEFVFYASSMTFATIYWTIVRLGLLPGRFIRSSFCQLLIQFLTTAFGRTFNWPSAILPTIYQHIKALFKLDDPESWNGFNYMTHHIYNFWSVKSSFDFDLVWLCIRDNYFQSTCSRDSWLYQNRFDHQEHGASYDSVCGLCEELMKEDVNLNADFESPVFTAYQCALDLSSINQLRGAEQINNARTQDAYFTTILGYGQLTPLSPFPYVMENATLGVICDEAAFVLLNFAYSKLYDSDISAPQLSRHLAETSFRLLAYLYSHPHLTYMGKKLEDGQPEVLFSAEDLYVMKIFEDVDQPFTTQWALIIDLYFRAFDHPSPSGDGDIDFRNNFHAHPFIQDFIWNFWKEIDHEYSKKSVHPNTLKQVTRTFHLIKNVLRNSLRNGSGHILECAFYPAAIYIQSCRRLLPDHEMLAGVLDILIPILGQCKEVVTSRDGHYQYLSCTGDSGEDSEMIIFSEAWWEVLFPSHRKSSLSRTSSKSVARP